MWNAPSESFARDIRDMDHIHDDARYFLLYAGSDYFNQLAESHIWLSRSNYIVLVHDNRQCSETFNFISHREVFLVSRLYFVLSSCPEFAYILKPDASNDYVILNINNVTAAVSVWSRKLPEIRNSTWRVAMFHRYPTAVKARRSKQKWTDFEGIDGFFLETIADHYKLKPIMVFPEDGQTFGAYENGTASGTLGIVIRGEADIALNGRFLIDYGTSEIDFTSPYLTDRLCIMAPRSKRVPRYIAMFRCFDYPTWILLLLGYMVGSFVWSLLDQIFEDRNHFRCASTASRDVYFMMLAGQVSKLSPRTHSARILIASCLLFNVVFMGAFQGLLYKSMTSPTFYPELNTLDDVDRSGFPVVTASLSLKDAFPATDDDPLIQRLRSKLYVVRDEALWNKIKEDDSNYATLWRENGAFLRLHQLGHLKLHLVKECPRSYFLTFVLQKKSPYLNIVNSFITRCHEHGLLQLWRDRTYKFSGKDLYHTQSFNRDLIVELHEIQAPLFLLCIGLTSSALVFFYENATQRQKEECVTATLRKCWRYAAHAVQRIQQLRHAHFPFSC